MLNDIGILFGFASLAFILLYVSMYVLRDLYSITSNYGLKRFINKILSMISRYNHLFLGLSTLFAIIHFLCFIKVSSFMNSGYMTLLMIFIVFKSVFLPSKNKNYTYNYSFLAYVLFGSLLIHTFI